MRQPIRAAAALMLACVTAVLAGPPAFAHHSVAMYDNDHLIELSGTVTRVVNAMGLSGPPVNDAAFARLYEELRRLASTALRKERDRGPFQTTALVHEVLLKLGQFGPGREWESRAHFFGAAARAMRQILVTEARRRAAEGRVLKLLTEARAGSAREIVLLRAKADHDESAEQRRQRQQRDVGECVHQRRHPQIRNSTSTVNAIPSTRR